MRVGIGCDGAVPAAVADVLGAAGLSVETVRGVAGPAVVAAGDTRWLIASSADVSLCCESGALDAAVVGKHVLMEREPDIAELLDLRVLNDRMVYAGPGGAERRLRRSRLRVATRYPRIAREYFARSGRQVQTLELTATSLAPALHVADGVVDLESRLAAQAPEFVVFETLATTSARLVASRAARALLGAELAALAAGLRAIVESA